MSTTLLAFLARPGDAARPCADITGAGAGHSWRHRLAAAVAVAAGCTAAMVMAAVSPSTNQLQPAYATFGTKRHGRRPSEVLIT